MTDKIIDFARERAERDQPDAEWMRKDDFGRPLYCFLMEYQSEGEFYSIDLSTYSFEDAEKAAAAIRGSLTVVGKKMSVLPW